MTGFWINFWRLNKKLHQHLSVRSCYLCKSFSLSTSAFTQVLYPLVPGGNKRLFVLIQTCSKKLLWVNIFESKEPIDCNPSRYQNPFLTSTKWIKKEKRQETKQTGKNKKKELTNSPYWNRSVSTPILTIISMINRVAN